MCAFRLPGRARPYQRYKRGEMNKTESKYADLLTLRKMAGEIHEWWYEVFTFKLADGCRFSPDFMIQLPDGTLELHETKGSYQRDDARVKAKIIAAQLPFKFIIMAYTKKLGWKKEEF